MHIGGGAWTSKTECVFFPPPQFFQHSQQCAAAATIIQRTFRRTSNRETQIIEQPAQSSTCPTDLHIGYRVIVTLSHPMHAGKAGTVCRHTKKYVMFTPDKHPTKIICKLPKSLAAYHLDGRCMINSFDDNKEHDLGQTECEHKMYNQLDKTKDFPVADGFVSFTPTLRYLGSLISYNLGNDDNITARIAAANASMGALKELWHNPHLDMYNKYLRFRAILMNLLLWGAETWSLQKSQLDKLDVFLHQRIQHILQILMTKVQDQRLRNVKVHDMFYSIRCIKNMIAARQMDFVGKMVRGPPDCPSSNMITACCDHKCQVERPQTMGKNFMVIKLGLLFQDIPTVQINRHGSLCSWIHEASNAKFWCQHVDQLLHPATPVPERPVNWGPLPSWQAHRATNGPPPPPNGDTSNSDDKTTADNKEE